MVSIRLLLALVASHGWLICYIDVKSTFLHDDLHKEIYMDKPIGFIQYSSLVYRLRKYLYGLKQAPQAWYEKIYSFLLSIDFVQCFSDLIVNIWRHGEDSTILVLYVDDLLLIDTSHSHI